MNDIINFKKIQNSIYNVIHLFWKDIHQNFNTLSQEFKIICDLCHLLLNVLYCLNLLKRIGINFKILTVLPVSQK